MALTRKLLKSMGLTEEQIDSVIEAHTETVDALKAYKDDAEKLPGLKKELEQAKNDLEAAGKDTWKVKYEALKEETEKAQKAQAAKDAKSAKESAYKKLLSAEKVDEKRHAAILRATDLDALELTEDGSLVDAEKHSGAIRTEWADFISDTQTKGVTVVTPPDGGNTDLDKLSDADYYKQYFADKNKKG